MGPRAILAGRIPTPTGPRTLEGVMGDSEGKQLTAELIGLVAERFKALAEPARLQILQALRTGEHTVTELVDSTGLGQANVSKHLQLLHGLGFVDRRKDGLYVHYRLSGEDIFLMCDLMCGRIEDEAARRLRLTKSD
jgi:DNA-binding transcriptional ArsR family regulator